MGRDPAPTHICIDVVRELQAEWREYELTLNGYMEKMNAWAARQAKRDKRAAERALDGETESAPAQPMPTSRAEMKAQLRRQLAGQVMSRRGLLPAYHNGDPGDDP